MTKTKTAAIIGGAVFAATAAVYAAKRTEKENLETVESVDLKRYIGKWYEIARYPNRFQKKCAENTTAHYSMLKDGSIGVVNFCRKQDGKLAESRGRAKVVDRETNAKLKVTFFWPFTGDYWIIGLDREYKWAIVGEPSRKYLWILSRTPEMSGADYEHALRTIRKCGYDDSKLMKTPQRWVMRAVQVGRLAEG